MFEQAHIREFGLVHVKLVMCPSIENEISFMYAGAGSLQKEIQEMVVYNR